VLSFSINITELKDLGTKKVAASLPRTIRKIGDTGV
jgi:hypothetical protein